MGQFYSLYRRVVLILAAKSVLEGQFVENTSSKRKERLDCVGAVY